MEKKAGFFYFSNSIRSLIQYTELTFQYDLDISVPKLFYLLSVLSILTPFPGY